MKQQSLSVMALSLHCMLQISCSKIEACCTTYADIITMLGTATGIKVIKVQDQAHVPAQDAVWVLEQAPADQQRSTRRFALRWLPTSLPPPLLDYVELPERAARARAFGQRHQCRPRQKPLSRKPTFALAVLSCSMPVASCLFVSALARSGTVSVLRVRRLLSCALGMFGGLGLCVPACRAEVSSCQPSRKAER